MECDLKESSEALLPKIGKEGQGAGEDEIS